MKKLITSFNPPETEIARGKLTDLQKLAQRLRVKGHECAIVKFHRADGAVEDVLELPRHLKRQIFG